VEDKGWWPPLTDLLLVAIIGLLVQTFWALQLTQPTYMDAYYYTTNGRQLSEGAGFEENIIWQFLDEPEGVPTPSHTYWMPLTSIIASIGYRLAGTFRAAQIPFVLMGGLLPLLAFAVSWQLAGLRWQAWVAAMFTAAGSFYAAFLSQPSTFAPFALAGGGCLLVLAIIHRRFDKSARFVKSLWFYWLGAGILAGLAHLTRGDGLLFLFLGLTFLGWQMWQARSAETQSLLRTHTPLLGLLLGGYLLVMGWWFIHNLQVIGRPLSTAGTQSMFLTTYDDLFAYGRSFALQSYLDWGLGNILRSKLWALWLGGQSLFVVSGMVFLSPFIIIGWVQAYRDGDKRRFLRPFNLYTLSLFLFLTLLFTFPGERGSIFHSSIAIWPWMAALAALGIGAAVDWVASKLSHWQSERAKRLFSLFFIIIAFVVSLVIGLARIVPDPTIETYGEIAAEIPNESKVMVGIAPAFYYHTGIAALSVPNEPIETVLEAAELYDVTYLILDQNHPAPLRDIYTGDEQNSRLEIVETFGNGVRLYRILVD
jgi:hypothetical protein